MRNLILISIFLVASQASAVDLPTARVVFDFPETAGTIRKMQVDLTDKNNFIGAKAKCRLADGKSETVILKCKRLEKQEYDCHRDDNGGAFNLILEPTPKITIGTFSADDEDVEKEVMYLKGQANKPLMVEGKKATISHKDAF